MTLVMRVLNHAIVFKAKHVAFVSADPHSIMFVLIVRFEDKDLLTYYKLMFDFASEHLLWTTRSSSIPFDKLSERGLTIDGYHVDIQSIKIHFGLWKCLHQTALSKGKPIPYALKLFLRQLRTGIRIKCLWMLCPGTFFILKSLFEKQIQYCNWW